MEDGENKESGNKENTPKDSKLSEYSVYDKEEERRKVRAEYRQLNKLSEGMCPSKKHTFCCYHFFFFFLKFCTIKTFFRVTAGP